MAKYDILDITYLSPACLQLCYDVLHWDWDILTAKLGSLGSLGPQGATLVDTGHHWRGWLRVLGRAEGDEGDDDGGGEGCREHRVYTTPPPPLHCTLLTTPS